MTNTTVSTDTSGLGGGLLPSWRQTPTRQSIIDFVDAVTDPKSPDFVEESERVAVFDNDGTLWAEQPARVLR